MPGLLRKRKPRPDMHFKPPRPRRIVIGGALGKVLRHLPHAIAAAFYNTSAPQGFEAPDMSLPPGLRCRRIICDMQRI